MGLKPIKMKKKFKRKLQKHKRIRGKLIKNINPYSNMRMNNLQSKSKENLWKYKWIKVKVIKN